MLMKVRRANNQLESERAQERELLEFLPREAISFDHALRAFLRECRIRNLSQETLRFYRETTQDIARLLAFTANITSPVDVTERDIEECILLKKEMGILPTTINTCMRGWRAFFNFLHNKGYMAHNPISNIKSLKTELRVVHAFTEDQLAMILKEPDLSTFTGYRNYTLMLTLLETGIRIAEAERIKLGDIHWREGLIRIFGKGRKERFVPFQKTLEECLRKYISLRGELYHDYLFVGIDNQPLKKRSMQWEINKIAKALKLKDVRVSAHTFRHTFAKMYIRNGGDAFSLKTILGHTSLEMTNRYVTMFGTDIVAQHRKYSPLESIKGILS